MQNAPVPVKIIGTDRFGKNQVKPAELFKEYGLTPLKISLKCKDAIAMK